MCFHPIEETMVYTVHTLPVPDFDAELQRDANVYVAPLPEPLLLQTPVVTIGTPLVIDEELQDFVTLKFKKAHLKAFTDIETSLKELALSRKLEWFKNEELADETIETAFKTFIDLESKTIRVRVDDELSVFDAAKNTVNPPPEGTKVKAVLELKRATLTKTQFGAVWTLKHLKIAEPSEAAPAYLFDPEETPDYAAEITDKPLDDQTLLAASDIADSL